MRYGACSQALRREGGGGGKKSYVIVVQSRMTHSNHSFTVCVSVHSASTIMSGRV